jgi:hypothetical protein
MIAERTRKRAKRLLWWSSGLVGVYALLGFVLAPMIAKGQLMPFVQERLGLQASVARIDLNPFTFTVSIADLDFLDESGERVLALDSARVNLQAMQLIRGAISLRELTLNGLYIGVHRYADGNLNFARIAERFAATAPPVPAETPEDGAGQVPKIEINLLSIDGASVGIIDEVPAVPFITLVELIDFTLLDLSTLTETSAEQSFTLALGDGSQLRWRGDLSLTPVSSSGELQLFGPLTDVAYRYFQAQIPVELEGGWFDSKLNYAMSLREDGTFDLQVHDLQASLRNLDIRTLEDRARLALLPSIVVSGGELNLLDRRAKLARVQLDDFEFLPTRFADGSINFLKLVPASEPGNEAFDSAAPSAEQGEPWDVEVTEILVEAWQISARDEVPAQGVDVALEFAAHITNISNRANSPINVDTNLTLRSGGALRAGGALTVLPALRFDGEFALDEFGLPVLQPYLESVANIDLESGRLSLAGVVRATASQSEITGSMSLNDLAITDRIQNEALFGIGDLQVDSAAVFVGERNNIEVGTVRIRQPYARVEIEADGSTNIGRVLVSREPEEAPAVATAPAVSKESFPVTLESIEIEQASADFSDRSLPLPFAVRMDALGGDISALSTQSMEPARVDLEGQVDEYGQVTISGRLRPLDYASLTEMDLFFRNLDIPSLSPYVIKFAGRAIAEGDLDVDLSYRINDGQLNGANSMVMRDLVLGERFPSPDAFDLPLGLAIALLKDRNGVIDLDVPVTGELNNPQFSFGNVISQALANIISNIVSSPFRFLANLVGGEDDADIGTIEFPPGRADLAPPEREKLAKLGSAMLERPQLQLGLTGVYVTAADGSALQERFFDSRLEAAIETASLEVDAPQLPSILRTQVLEGLYQASAQDPAELVAAQGFLIELQQQHSRDDAAQQSQVDTVAYNAALRRVLIEREAITEAELAQLARQRADAIGAEFASIDPLLAQRLQREGDAQAVELSEGRVPMALSLSAQGN